MYNFYKCNTIENEINDKVRKKTAIEVLKICDYLQSTNNYKIALSNVVNNHIQDIARYSYITGITINDFLWINNIAYNNVSFSMMCHFFSLITSVLLVKYSDEETKKVLIENCINWCYC